jgi:hypothetical protein
VHLAGFPAWVLWLIVHLGALTGFKHRLSVFFNWIVGLLGGGRAQRVITLQQVFGRHAMAARAAAKRRATPGVVESVPTECRRFADHSEVGGH